MEPSPQAGRETRSTLALPQGQRGNGNQQPEGQSSAKNGHQPDVHTEPRRLLTAASISVVAVVQLLWVALLVYGAYWVAALLVR